MYYLARLAIQFHKTRTFSRELLAINTNLRYNLQNLETKLSNLAGPRPDVVDRIKGVLLQREDELAALQRECKQLSNAAQPPQENVVATVSSPETLSVPSKRGVVPSISKRDPQHSSFPANTSDANFNEKSAMKVLLLESQRLKKALQNAELECHSLQDQVSLSV